VAAGLRTRLLHRIVAAGESEPIIEAPHNANPHSDTVRNPPLAIDESGVFEERAELR
jgi:hypothetical protein